MRIVLALVILSPLMTGCTPYIPVKDDFGISALAPSGDVPPEFAEFNANDPAVNGLLADQLCATSYQPLEEKSLGASTGRLIQARGRCRTHIPLIGP
ncbi:MAG: hypothetical protein WA459_03655 [Stellaceae bacterium]